jgi:hypothetical protein
MIKKYFDFLNESFELILESDVVYSDKFRLVLSKIENPVSTSLLGAENKDLDVRSNYFDIVMDKNDKVSFIPDRRAQQILTDSKITVRFVGRNGGWLTFNKDKNGEYENKILFDALGFTPSEELIKPGSDETGEIIKKTVSEKSGRTFVYVKFPNTELVINAQSLREVDENSKLVWTTNRQEVRVGRAIRALLSSTDDKFLDKDIEVFVNLYKATIDKFNDKFSLFSEVTGDKIGYWYHNSHYYSTDGVLGSSCMSSVDEEFFDIYISNPDVCSLVIYESDEEPGKILGRALLWKIKDGKRFMDRIYTVRDSDVQLFKDYAKENGWYTKVGNASNSSNNCIAPDGSNTTLDLTVKIKSGEYEKYPYLDTLKYWNDSGSLSTSNCGNCYTLEDTDGEYYRCESCNGSGEVECYDCEGRGEVECSDCDGRGVETCGECDGEGTTIETGSDGEEHEKDCDDCDGKGNIDCSSCDGNGENGCSECSGDGTVICYDCQ